MTELWTRAERKRQILGLVFTGPWILGFLVFALYPVIASFYYSLCDYNVFDPPAFNGGRNYVELVREDKLFWRSLWNTGYFMFFAIPTTMLTALVLAMLLNLKVRGQAFYRTVFFLPSIVPVVASTVLWLWILNPRYGVANKILGPMSPYLQIGWDALRDKLISWGVENVPALRFPPGWLTNEYWSKPGLILMSVWGVGNNMILYLAGLQEVPKELYEAAEIDGASAWKRTWHITLPMISPILFFTLVMGMIGTFQYFTQAFIMTDGGGGPNDSTLFYAMYLFNNAFIYFKMGYASAMAWILFVLIVICTALTFRLTRGRVYYAGA